MTALPPELRERVLARLGVARPRADEDGLREVYAAWCRRVPFDNVRKRIHVHAGRQEALPGDEPAGFFEDWLADGTGGTCWAGNGALHALLTSLGFDATRGIGTMLVVPDVPPNHATVGVDLRGRRWLVDASILHGEPLLLDAERETSVEHPAFGVRCTPDGERWRVRWRPLHLPDGMDCRIERFGATADEYRTLHEATRAWSPFNYQLSARLVAGDAVVGVGFGARGEIRSDGSMEGGALDDAGRRRTLCDVLGMSTRIAKDLPDDVPTPPPPGSRTAASS
ncbi:MAG: arylamine N-acetyltransferase [Myxococcota bacterium]